MVPPHLRLAAAAALGAFLGSNFTNGSRLGAAAGAGLGVFLAQRAQGMPPAPAVMPAPALESAQVAPVPGYRRGPWATPPIVSPGELDVELDEVADEGDDEDNVVSMRGSDGT